MLYACERLMRYCFYPRERLTSERPNSMRLSMYNTCRVAQMFAFVNNKEWEPAWSIGCVCSAPLGKQELAAINLAHLLLYPTKLSHTCTWIRRLSFL